MMLVGRCSVPCLLRAALSFAMLAVASGPASATFHLWFMDQLYSNASGTVQFLELTALAPGQEFVGSHTLKVVGGGVSHTFTLPGNLPGDSSGHRFLVGTQSFAALNVVQPDYIVPDNFFPTGGGTVTWGEGADVWVYPALPNNGRLAQNRAGTTATNSAVNFAGQAGSVAANGLAS